MTAAVAILAVAAMLGAAVFVLCAAILIAKRQTADERDPHAEKPPDVLPPFHSPQASDTVLVGALSSQSQLYVCLGCNFYHMPASLAGKGYKDVKYVAIYQSRRFFGRDAGVRYFGRVTSAKRVHRREITEIDKGGRGYYIRFEIDSWLMLEPPIMPKGEGITAAFTNYSLLSSARDMDGLLGR